MPKCGSSLRTRGTGKVALPYCFSVRFIPAYAGNGAGHGSPATFSSVHPCVRGERPAIWGANPLPPGSSLRTRGTVAGYRSTFAAMRFIPAYAGNGGRRHCCGRCRAVHPCVRGERPCWVFGRRQLSGSSLRTRGTGARRPWHPALQRFIPAYAGNGPNLPQRRRPRPVHPCVRGERVDELGCGHGEGGSSLRTRGTGKRGAAWMLPRRFIPAYAGNGSEWNKGFS